MLSRLKELDIRTNSFSGDFPIEIFNLIGLEQLSLDQNTMNITQLSPNIGSMVQLKSLRMEQCGLMGSIPTEIGGLTNLVTLSFRGNKMTGTIPDSIGNAKNLLYVNLSNNKLRGTLAAELGLLRKINVLDVSKNELTGSIPGALSRLTTYQVELNFSRNKLTGTIPKDICVQSCCAVAIVNVDGNDVKACEPKVPCADCSILGVSSNVLRSFDISSNYSLP
jgi:Leucine-rich repeat (LRR) protein